MPLAPALLKGQLHLLTLFHLSEVESGCGASGGNALCCAPFVTTHLLKLVTFQTTAEASESPPGHRK